MRNSPVSLQFDKYINELISSRLRIFPKLERVLGSGLQWWTLRKLIIEEIGFLNQGQREESLGHPLAHFNFSHGAKVLQSLWPPEPAS